MKVYSIQCYMQSQYAKQISWPGKSIQLFHILMCHLNIFWTEPRRSNWEDRAEPRYLQECGLGQDEVRSVLESHLVLVPRHPVHLILDSVEDVRILEAEEEGKAECLAHRPAAAGEEVNEGDH